MVLKDVSGELFGANARRVEELEGGWQRLYLDCPKCQASEALQLDTHFDEDDNLTGRTSVMRAVTPNCPNCHAAFRVEEPEQ